MELSHPLPSLLFSTSTAGTLAHLCLFLQTFRVMSDFNASGRASSDDSLGWATPGSMSLHVPFPVWGEDAASDVDCLDFGSEFEKHSFFDGLMPPCLLDSSPRHEVAPTIRSRPESPFAEPEPCPEQELLGCAEEDSCDIVGITAFASLSQRVDLFSLAHHAPEQYKVSYKPSMGASPTARSQFDNAANLTVCVDGVNISGLVFVSGKMKITAVKKMGILHSAFQEIVEAVRVSANAALRSNEAPCVEDHGSLCVEAKSIRMCLVKINAEVFLDTGALQQMCYPELTKALERYAHGPCAVFSEVKAPKSSSGGTLVRFKPIPGMQGQVSCTVFWTGKMQLNGSKGCSLNVILQYRDQLIGILEAVRPRVQLLQSQNPFNGEMNWDGGRRRSRAWTGAVKQARVAPYNRPHPRHGASGTQ